MELWLVRSLMVASGIISVFGFLNAFYLQRDGPGGDLGIVAGAIALLAFWIARRIQKNGST